MKRLLLAVPICISVTCFSQNSTVEKPAEKTGLFKNLNIKSGFSMSYFYNFQGEYVYYLQPDAHVKEKIENKMGAALSIVVLIPFDDKSKLNFLINLPVADINNNTTFFNSQTPFGVGAAWFPLKKPNFLGISTIFNFGRQDRMDTDALQNTYFPIANNSTLKVDSPVPQAILQSYTHKVTTVSVDFGLIVRL